MSSDVRASSKAAARELASVDSAAGRVVSELLPLVLAELPALLDAVTGPMSRLEPTVGAALREARAEALSAAEAAVGLVIAETEARLRDLPSDPDGALAQRMRLLARQVGRARRLRGEPLWPLFPAYRRGALLGWRRIATLARRTELPPAVLVRSREAVFGLVEDLTTATVDGYVHEREAAAQPRRR
jgi:hypothetical protein